MNIIIIEDESMTAEDLADYIRELQPDFQIVKILSSVQEAIAYFKNNVQSYDLIFTDIQLGDGLCFEIFKQFMPKSPVIFCTAYNQYALEAFKVNGIDYILKPFDKKSIASALDKYLSLKSNFAPPVQDNFKQLLALLEQQKNNTSNPKIHHILVHQKDKIIPIPITEIALFFIKHETTILVNLEAKHFIINQTLDELEDLLDHHFFRINRQFLVQRKTIKDASQYFARKLLVNLNIDFEEQILVSKEKTPLFLEWLMR